MPPEANAPSSRPPEAPALRIAGAGLVSPLGFGLWPTFQALLRGRRITDRMAQLDDDTEPLPMVAAIGGIARARHPALDPTIEIAEAAAREAAQDAGVRLGHDTPVWIGSSKGAVQAMHDFTDAVHQGRTPRWQSQAPATAPHAVLSYELQRRLRAPVAGVCAAACASGLVALHCAAQAMRRTNGPRCAVVLGVDAGFVPSLIASYRRLGVLARPRHGAYQQQPFSREAQGFVLSESAAAVVLTAEDRPTRQGPVLAAAAIGCEAHDIVRPPDPLAVQTRLLQRVWPRHGVVVAHHPHAPGTPGHDAAEWAALQRVEHDHGADPAPLYAVKGALGHSLGASGMVALAIACAAMRARRLPPMPWLTGGRIQGLDRRTCSTAPVPVDTGSHLVSAAGFGGHAASVRIDP